MHRGVRRTALAGMAGLAALATALPLAASAGPSDGSSALVSRQSAADGGAGGDDPSFNPAISANGRWVAFESQAGNLGGPTQTTSSNIYRYDRKERRVLLISRRSGKPGDGGDNASYNPEISADGQVIVFETVAANLGGPIQTNPALGEYNIYVYDVSRRRVELVSRRSKSIDGKGADGTSFDATISPSGRWVVYSSYATNLSPAATDGTPQVYRYDRKTKTTILISRQSRSAGSGASNGFSAHPSIDKSGNLVAFDSEGTNLGGPTQTDPADADSNIYLRNIAKRRTTLISRRSAKMNGKGANDDSDDPFIAANGRFIGFETNATNLGGPIQTDPANFDDNIYVYDLATKTVTLISRRSNAADGEGADADSDDPVLTPDGRFVAFETNATNLSGPLDPNNTQDYAYLYDRKLKRTENIGVGTGGIACDYDCEDPVPSADGNKVAFEYEGSDFPGPHDPLVGDNVFVRLRR